MSSWTLTNQSTGQVATFDIESGDVEFLFDRQVSVRYPLRGSSPYVQTAPTQLPRIRLPRMMTKTDAEYNLLFNVLSLGAKLTLVDDLGQSREVMVASSIDTTVADTPRNQIVWRFTACEFVQVS
jgi:hypothetical protein